jgi:SAM-dependent methyltransferase
MRRVLDAGCGSRRPVARDPDLFVVGLDISKEALTQNAGLDERILGDLQDYPLPPESFEEILCQDVLEHLPEPERALSNLAQALAPGGMLTIGVPNLLSLKGLVTKLAPFWFHRWVYRRLFHSEYEPAPTYFRWTIRPGSLRSAARRHGLAIERSFVYSASLPHLSWLGWRSEYRLVLDKPPATTSTPSAARPNQGKREPLPRVPVK